MSVLRCGLLLLRGRGDLSCCLPDERSLLAGDLSFLLTGDLQIQFRKHLVWNYWLQIQRLVDHPHMLQCFNGMSILKYRSNLSIRRSCHEDKQAVRYRAHLLSRRLGGGLLLPRLEPELDRRTRGGRAGLTFSCLIFVFTSRTGDSLCRLLLFIVK